MPRRPSVRGGPGPSKIVSRGSLPVRSEISFDPNWWARPRDHGQRKRKIGLGHNRHSGGGDDSGISSGTLFDVITQVVDAAAALEGTTALNALGERAAQPIRDGLAMFEGTSALNATGVLYAPAVGWVKSVELISPTIVSAASTTTATTKSQIDYNCFPLPYSVNGNNNKFANRRCADITISGSTVSTSRALNSVDTSNYKFYLVEVAQNAAKIQVLSFSIASGSTTATVDIPQTINLSKTFAVITYTNDNTDQGFDRSLVRVELVGTSTAGVSLSRGSGTSGAISGHVYLVECLTDAFTVQQVNIDTGSSATATGSLTAVTTDKTFLVGSLEHRGNGSSPDMVGTYYELTNTTTVTFGKTTGSGTYQAKATVFAVSLKSDGGTVQHGSFNRSSGTTGTSTITAVTVASTAVVPHAPYGAGVSASTTATDMNGINNIIELTDSTTITGTQSTAPAAITRTHYWSAIDFTLTT